MATASLLTAQQRKLCQTQSNQPAPNGPRAKALLALDEGNTQQQAAETSELSLGRYATASAVSTPWPWTCSTQPRQRQTSRLPDRTRRHHVRNCQQARQRQQEVQEQKR